MNILYFGFDMFAPCLEFLLSRENIKIMKIYSFESDGYFDFHDKIKSIASKNNIEFSTEKITKDELLYQKEKGADFIFCAGYAYRIPVENLPDIKAVNIHPSLLPNGRGPWPLPWVILNDEKTAGVTAHKLSEKIDEGDIILQKEFSVSENEDYFSLEAKMTETALKITKELFENFNFTYSNSKKQCKGKYLAEPSDDMRTIYDDTPSEQKNKIIRAFGKDYVIYGGKRNEP